MLAKMNFPLLALMAHIIGIKARLKQNKAKILYNLMKMTNKRLNQFKLRKRHNKIRFSRFKAEFLTDL
jgi:hypothetical protein